MKFLELNNLNNDHQKSGLEKWSSKKTNWDIKINILLISKDKNSKL